MIASGTHCILFITARGSMVSSAILPVKKNCSNLETYQPMTDDMEVDAGKILNKEATLDEVGKEIFDKIIEVAQGVASCLESLGHREFVLGYITFVPVSPSDSFYDIIFLYSA